VRAGKAEAMRSEQRGRNARRRRRAALALALTLAACDGEGPSRGSAGESQTAPAASHYVGSARCAECHAAAFAAWSGSHHARAMQEASEATVLGGFADARFEADGAVTRFTRRDGSFLVESEADDGARGEFPVAYTFGVTPLQQYLVERPGGRLQALTVAWDSRPAAVGGQRWFSLHPGERTRPGDVLHWTGPANRWNTMCAHCHSTHVRKGFDLETGRYATTWSELDVGCEACHGPGSRHVAWAESGSLAPADRGLAVDLMDEAGARWVPDPETGISRRQPPRHTHTELETCAPCHARRSLLDEPATPGRFLDAYRPALLEEGLYYPDGQIRDEVYVYGSFLQSRMYRAGVTCSNCHEPHALTLRGDTETVCAQCHAPERFAQPSHHHHEVGSQGARCVSCHMPARTYMGVDARRDHSLRVPRPALSAEVGAPDACTACHRDRSSEWAAQVLARWPNARRQQEDHFGRAFAAAQRGLPGSGAALERIAADPLEAGIVRASALALRARVPGAPTPERLAAAVRDEDPLVRLAAVRVGEALPVAPRMRALGALLDDPLRAVRADAGRALAAAPDSSLPPARRAALQRALAEYRAAQRLHADEPSAHVNLGLLHLARGQLERAEAAYRDALQVGDYFVPAYVNLADLLRQTGRDAEGERWLRSALEVAPESADAHHALGLLLVRAGRRQEALAALARAAALAPESARFAFVYALALQGEAREDEALQTLEAALVRHPGERSLELMRIDLQRRTGRTALALEHAQRLAAAAPDDPELRSLVATLRAVERTAAPVDPR